MSRSEGKSADGGGPAPVPAAGRRQLRSADTDPKRLLHEVDRLKSELSKLTQRFVEELDAGRLSIARELHDNFGQFLTVLDMELSAVIGQSEPPAALGERMARLRALAREAHRDVDRIAGDLRLPSLEGSGLGNACAQLLEAWGKRSALTFDLHVALPAQGVPPTVATVLYRVLQEAITNVARHAKASRVGVILQLLPHEVQMIVEDDGIGISWTKMDGAAMSRFGLIGARERLALVGGTLEIEFDEWQRHNALDSCAAVTSETTASSPLRVLLADDHPVVLAGVKALVTADEGLTVVGEAADGQTALRLAAELKPDILVLDISMPGLNGVKVAELIGNACPDCKILALTVHEDRGYLRQLLELGVAGYMLKRSAAEDLVRAIRAISSGGLYLDPAVAGKAVGVPPLRPAGSDASAAADLSDREIAVLRLTVSGHSNKSMAQELRIAVKTIETYKARAMEKLGFRTRVELMRYAVSKGWLAES